MRIVVISHTAHHRSGGELLGWGPTVRELDHLASLFDELVHIAPVHDGPVPRSALPYQAPNVRVVAVPPAGGDSFGKKLGVLLVAPRYLRAISAELDRADVAHVRCPSNIGLIALLLLAMRRRPVARWIKYAGNWQPGQREGWSYSLQRRLLARGAPRSLVTVNGEWPNQPPHVRAFLNPCLTSEELREGLLAAEGKLLTRPLRLLFVGRADEEKGCGRSVDILATLRAEGIDAVLEVVGDGPDRKRFEARASVLGLGDTVRFVGWVPRPGLAEYYRQAHFLLLPSSSSEGWPKVLSEAMAYGAVPVTGNVSSIPQFLSVFRTGRALPAGDRDAFVEALRRYSVDPSLWKTESRNAVAAARSFSYEAYLEAVCGLLGLRAA